MNMIRSMHTIKAILFDLDGTLIDSVTDLANSVNHTLTQVGLPTHTREEIKNFVGDGVQKLIKRSLGQRNMDRYPEAFALFMDHYAAHCTDNTTLYQGVAKTLPLLKQKYWLAVLTNKSVVFSRKILRSLEIDSYFKEVMGGDSLSTKKPDPAGIFHLAAKWGINPATEVIMVGDHATDIEVGQRAGCRTVFVAGTIGQKRGLTPDFVIESMVELPGLLERI